MTSSKKDSREDDKEREETKRRILEENPGEQQHQLAFAKTKKPNTNSFGFGFFYCDWG